MKPGDIVYHRQSGQRMQVKETTHGNGFVLCVWIGKDDRGRPVVCSGSFNWQELCSNPPEPATVREPVVPPTMTFAANDVGEMEKFLQTSQVGTLAANPPVEPSHKRKRQ